MLSEKVKVLRGFYEGYSSADLSRSMQFTLSQSTALQKVIQHGKTPLHRVIVYILLYNMREKAKFNDCDLSFCYADAARLYADLPQPLNLLRHIRARRNYVL